MMTWNDRLEQWRPCEVRNQTGSLHLLYSLLLTGFRLPPTRNAMLHLPPVGLHRRQTLNTSILVWLQWFLAGPTLIIIWFPCKGVAVTLNWSKCTPAYTFSMVESLYGQAASNNYLVGDFLACERANAICVVIGRFWLDALQGSPHGIKWIILLNTTAILAVLLYLGLCKLSLRYLGV